MGKTMQIVINELVQEEEIIKSMMWVQFYQPAPVTMATLPLRRSPIADHPFWFFN